MTTYIYALVDPRDATIRYIGKTIRPIKRRRQHKNEGHSQEIQMWGQKLTELGLDLEMKILEEVSDGDDWRVAESYWVRYALNQGWPILNKVAGGDGVPLRYITDQDPNLRIYRCIRITETTGILLGDMEYMSLYSAQHKRLTGALYFRKSDELLYAALTQLNIYDDHGPVFYEKYQEYLRAKAQNLPKWQSAPRNTYGSLWLDGSDDAKDGIYNVAVFMKKKTGDFLDELAAKSFNGKRRGYNTTLYNALFLLKEMYEKGKYPRILGMGIRVWFPIWMYLRSRNNQHEK